VRISSQHRRTLPAALALSLAILALAGSSPAAASPLDLTFGGGAGFATASGFESQPTEVLNAMVVQGDGKIVLGGRATDATTHGDFALARFNADGSLDTTFGPAHNGKVAVPLDNGTDEILGLALQPDGKIIAVGEVDTSVASSVDFGVIRLDQNGSLDTTFGPGHDGKLVLPVGTGSSGDYAYAATVQSSGKIVVAGEAQGPGGDHGA